ncbi:MAG: FtsW/RodA/SpoVE family cell cycle protein [Micrococcales bacterium]
MPRGGSQNLNPRNLGSAASAWAKHFFSRVFAAQSSLFWRIILVTTPMLIIGVIMVLSSSSVDSILNNNGNGFATFGKQLLYASVGAVLLLVASLVSPDFYQRHAMKIFWSVLALQASILFLGVSVNGNKAWLDIGFTKIQPSEFLKIGLILAIAWHMEDRQHLIHDPRSYRNFLVFVPLGVIGAATLITSDVGTAMILVLIVLVMVWLSGVPAGSMRLPLLVVAVAGFIAMNAAASRLGRIKAFFDPASDVTGLYTDQTQHGIWALAAGGIQGVGLGLSKMKWTWIPEVENDFIFAIIAEELGMIGAVTVICLFVYLGVLIRRVAQRANTVFKRMLVIGIGTWLIGQALINIAVVLNLFPVLGVPLPLISAGGSSLISGLGAIGIVLAIERDNHLNETNRGRARVKR